MKIIEGAPCAAKGFKAAACAAASRKAARMTAGRDHFSECGIAIRGCHHTEEPASAAAPLHGYHGAPEDGVGTRDCAPGRGQRERLCTDGNGERPPHGKAQLLNCSALQNRRCCHPTGVIGQRLNIECIEEHSGT